MRALDIAASALALLITSSAAAVAGPATPVGDSERSEHARLTMDAIHFRPGQDPLTGVDGYTGEDLFDLGYEALQRDEDLLARLLFERLLGEFPAHRQQRPAQYNLGLACARLEDFRCAAEQTAEYLPSVVGADSSREVSTRLQLADYQQRLGDYAASRSTLGPVLELPAASLYDRWEARILLARASAEAGDYAGAESELSRVLGAIRRDARENGGGNIWLSAMVSFHLAEVHSQHAASISFQDTADLTITDQLLREKADHVRAAFAQYKRCLKHQLPEWSGPSAHAMGRLYEVFRGDLMSAELPADLAPDEVPAYRELLGKRTRPLLEAASDIYDAVLSNRHTLRMERDWITAIEDARDRVEQELAAEREAELASIRAREQVTVRLACSHQEDDDFDPVLEMLRGGDRTWRVVAHVGDGEALLQVDPERAGLLTVRLSSNTGDYQLTYGPGRAPTEAGDSWVWDVSLPGSPQFETRAWAQNTDQCSLNGVALGRGEHRAAIVPTAAPDVHTAP